jgi:teichuronic acid biosynthesis glycosyltransferase TuaG
MESIYTNDLVSIITPAFNAAKFISICIESVIHQSYTNWEMIIVNDCSSDETEKIVQKYVKTENRIKLISLDKNIGVSGSRNLAIINSRGRYIAFLDSDDFWNSFKLEYQIKFMKDNNFGFTFTSYQFFKQGFYGKVVIAPKSVKYVQYLKTTIIGNSTVIMDKAILGDIVVEKGNLEDVLTWMKYLKKNFIANGLNINLSTYTVNSNSASGNKIRNALRYYFVLRKNQNLPILSSIYYFICYSWNALKKRL